MNRIDGHYYRMNKLFIHPEAVALPVDALLMARGTQTVDEHRLIQYS